MTTRGPIHPELKQLIKEAFEIYRDTIGRDPTIDEFQAYFIDLLETAIRTEHPEL
jgi:hypothetical protein